MTASDWLTIVVVLGVVVVVAYVVVVVFGDRPGKGDAP
jgi:hypothetical protein